MRGKELLARKLGEIESIHKEGIVVTESPYMRANQLHISLEALVPQSVAHRVAQPCHLGPSPHLLNQNLHFNKSCR